MVKIEALRAWGASKRGIVPMTVIDLRSDEDPRVRAAALLALAARKQNDAYDYLIAALNDVDLSVRLAAIHGLGELGDTRSLAACWATCSRTAANWSAPRRSPRLPRRAASGRSRRGGG